LTDLAAPPTAWLSEALGQFLACADPDALFAAMLGTVRSRAPVAILNVCRVFPPGDEIKILQCWAERSRLFRPGLRFRRDQSLIDRAFASEQPLYFPDYEELPEPPEFARRALADGVIAALVVPLVLQGRPRGSVNLGFHSRDPLDAQTLHLFITLARAYGALHFWMEDAASLARSQAVDRALGRVGLLLLESVDAEGALAPCARLLAVETRAQGVTLFGPGDGPPRLYACHPPEAAELGPGIATALAGLASAGGEPLAPGEVLILGGESGGAAGPKGLLAAARAKSAALTSLFVGGDRPGWLCAFRDRDEPWGEAERRLLSLAARMAALALERYLVEQRLRRSQTLQAVGQLAGGVAHDFNNLLGGILGCVYGLELQPVDGPAAGEFQRIRDLCRRGGDLTRRLLTFARRVPGRRETLDPGQLLREAAELLDRTLGKGIAVGCETAEGLPRILVDRSLLTTALLNLGLNARDAMRGTGTLALGARAEGGGVVLAIRDSGPGVPAAIRERIFEPFFTTKPLGHGTGLGLSMVYAACREHGGHVDVECPPEGGSTFRLWFPAASEHAEQGGPSAAAPDHPLTDRAVLVTVGEEPLARSIQHTLRAAGYRVEAATAGLEALETLERLGAETGLVILDSALPGLSGDQVLRILRGVAPHLPVLTILEEGGAPGPADCGDALARSFSAARLLEAVAESLGPAAAA